MIELRKQLGSFFGPVANGGADLSRKAMYAAQAIVEPLGNNANSQ
ncbi:MAG: hypothetical protein ACFFB3_14510 [Candidatus Hodarchaeota archaeon]